MSNHHTCILVTSRAYTAMCWGRNDFGQLGIGVSAALKSSPGVVVLDTGGSAERSGQATERNQAHNIAFLFGHKSWFRIKSDIRIPNSLGSYEAVMSVEGKSRVWIRAS